MHAADQHTTDRNCPVVAHREGRLGRITLNRPAALNTLTLPMIRLIRQVLQKWEDDPTLELIVLQGAGNRGFCAGGDLRTVYAAVHDDADTARTLWSEEYRLDAYLARYPRPVIAMMDGIVMGGGLGLTAHGAIRVLTERSVLAMPEVGIGLAPDVGSTFLLARMPGHLGRHLALTGARIGARDAVVCGLADHVIPANQLTEFLRTLHTHDPAEAASKVGEPADTTPAPLNSDRSWIDVCYAADHPSEILQHLRSHPHPRAHQAAAALEAASPTAVAVTLRALQHAYKMPDLESCFTQDYRVSTRFLAHPDLSEGIRAAVIDKDRQPRWNPAELGDITAEMVDAYFHPPADGDLHV